MTAMCDTSWIKCWYPDLAYDDYLAVMAGATGAVSVSDDPWLGNATLPDSPESRFSGHSTAGRERTLAAPHQSTHISGTRLTAIF